MSTARPSPEDVRHDCARIADLAAPDDTVTTLTQKTGLARSAVGRRIQAMERELGLDPATPAEKAAARFHGIRRAGDIARRWRRHCL